MFEENDGRVDNTKALLHAKRWDIYIDEKENLVKGGYLLEVVGHDKKKVLWEFVDNGVVEEPTENVSGRRRFLVRFQNGCEDNLSSNQLTALIVEKIPVEEEPEVSTIPEIPEDQVKLEKG